MRNWLGMICVRKYSIPTICGKIACQNERQWKYFVLAMGVTFGVLLAIAISMALLRWLIAS